VIATNRSSRSIIGSMNEAKFLLGHYVGARTDDSGEVDWAAARDELAQMPFTAVDGHFPDRRFAQLVVEGMRSGERDAFPFPAAEVQRGYGAVAFVGYHDNRPLPLA